MKFSFIAASFGKTDAMEYRRGLTLVEILVAVSIICVLAGLLVPAGKKIQERSMGIKCTSNLRALSNALISYTMESGGKFTSARWDNPATDARNPGFADYLGLTGKETQDTILSCPLIQKGEMPSRRPMHMSYGINTRATSDYHVNSLNRVSVVTDPTKFFLFTEGVVNPALGSQMNEPYNYYTAVSWAQMSLLQYPHGGRQNVAFMDGHVELLEREDFPEGSQAYKTKFWAGYSN